MENQLSLAEVTTLREQFYNATISYFVRLHDELFIIRVRPDCPIPKHKAGQYTSLGLGYWEPRIEGSQPENLEPGQVRKLAKRAYSLSCPIVNAAGELLAVQEEDFLEFYIALVRQADKPPALTPRLVGMVEGSRLFVAEKITGHYTLDPVKPNDTVLCMATGTGEAPHNKMILELLRSRHAGLIVSVICVRYKRDLAYLSTHLQLVERFPNYRYVTLTTREADNAEGKIYIQDLVRSGSLEETIGHPLDPASTHVYLCGNPNMIGIPTRDHDGQYHYPQPVGMVEILESRGFRADRPRDPGNIHYEKYW